MFLIKKKLFLLVPALVISMVLSACSKESSNSNDNTNDFGKSSKETTVTEEITDTSEESETKEGKDSSFDDNFIYADYAGEYQDSFSQRASMSIQDMGDCLKMNIHWSSSATESSVWNMTARFTSPDRLSYTDCEYGVIVFTDEGNDSYTKEYDSGEGYFTITDGKLRWDGAAEDFCRDCVFESMNFEYTDNGGEIRYIAENIDIDNLADGTYPVKIFFDKMKRNDGSLSLEFMIYTVVHYDSEDINNMKQNDIVYEYVDETTVNNYVVDTVNFPLDEVCVVNGGSERGEGITFTKDDTGFFRIYVGEGYTRNESHGVAIMEIPDTVAFEDNHDLQEATLDGDKLYDYFKGLSDTEKDYFNENNTFITVSDGKIARFYRIYLP